jgi:thiol:disulfide interchange protein
MRKALMLFVSMFGILLFAEPVCVDGMCYPSREDAIAAGAKLPENIDSKKEPIPASMSEASGGRIAMGFMKPAEMVAFLRNEEPEAPFAGYSVIAVFFIAVLGGLALNLTPCVLPLMPINLAVIGAGMKAQSKCDGAKRGAAYGFGIALTYGALGLLAAFGGVAFGVIQSNPWFNLFVAVVFCFLFLAMSDVFIIDFSKFRKRGDMKKAGATPLWSVFVMGAISAVLAGACVSPILIAVLMVSATGVGEGNYVMALLPFALGLGMALPWPLAGAGIAALPKPGLWMNWVKKIFSFIILLFVLWYGYLSWSGFFSESQGDSVTLSDWNKSYAEAKARGKPVFVDIWATWCKNCSAMETSTLRDKDVKKELENFTVLKLQAEDISELSKLPEFKNVKVTGLPAFLILNEKVVK